MRNLYPGLAGVGAGGSVEGLIGALGGSGILEAKEKLHESGTEEGIVVISLTQKNGADAKYLEDNWRTNLGEEVHYRTPNHSIGKGL